MPKQVTYKTSGVDIEEADHFVKAIQSDLKRTFNPLVIKRTGAFGGLFEFPKGYRQPVMVSSTDGVGTKLLIAQSVDKHDTVGVDLVAMNVNDVLCVGAKPLFFLDYIACGKLKTGVLKEVVKGIADGCAQSGCSIVGGETAEMPGMYKPNEYDLAGFVVGAVEKKKIIDGSTIKAGDKIIGLPSSGLHSNGFSLVRKVFSKNELKKYSSELLKPTRIYVKEVLPLLEKFEIKGIAHNTGGAFYEKLTKIVPQGKCLQIQKKSWPILPIFNEIQRRGKVEEAEMYRTFNMGIGLILVIGKDQFISLTKYLTQRKIVHYEIGDVVESNQKLILRD